MRLWELIGILKGEYVVSDVISVPGHFFVLPLASSQWLVASLLGQMILLLWSACLWQPLWDCFMNTSIYFSRRNTFTSSPGWVVRFWRKVERVALLLLLTFNIWCLLWVNTLYLEMLKFISNFICATRLR